MDEPPWLHRSRRQLSSHSLASDYNSIHGDGNTAAWLQGLRYVLTHHAVDLHALAKKNLRSDRAACFERATGRGSVHINSTTGVVEFPPIGSEDTRRCGLFSSC